VPRILYLVETTGHGGTEVVIVQLIRGLRGSEFTPVLGTVGEGWLAQKAREAGAKVVLLDPRSRYDGWDFTAVLRLAVLIWRQRIDLVHSFLFHMNVLGTLAARLSGRPCMASLRSVHYDFATWYRRWAWRLVARCATAITAVSWQARDTLCVHTGIAAERVTVIPNGVDTDRFRPGPKRGLLQSAGVPFDALVIGTVGRLDPVKGHRYLLEAAAEVVKAHPQCHFVLVGSDGNPEGKALRVQASRLSLDGRVHLLGERSDVPQLLREMDIFVLPSVSEGMSNALLEAMAARLPCVATAVGGNPETLGDAGLLVPPSDATCLGDALAKLLSDRELRRSLAQAARRRTLEDFSLRQSTERHLDLYAYSLRSTRRASDRCSY
jgi:glycosyltransferase involved in cell wall biosynthesis